jgi:hypothetical protein
VLSHLTLDVAGKFEAGEEKEFVDLKNIFRDKILSLNSYISSCRGKTF